MHRVVSEEIRTGLGVVPGLQVASGASKWLQGHQSGFRGLVAPGGEWLQVMSGSKYFGTVPGASGHTPG